MHVLSPELYSLERHRIVGMGRDEREKMFVWKPKVFWEFLLLWGCMVSPHGATIYVVRVDEPRVRLMVGKLSPFSHATPS